MTSPPATTLTPDDTPATTEPNSTGFATASPDPAISSYIDEQLKSDQYKSWLSAAGCADATPEQLLLAAQKCASISNDFDYACDIAEAIATNPNADGKALAALAGANYYAVVEIAAKSTHADGYALKCLAERCSNISNDFDYACDIAEAICKNPNATDESIAVLSSAQYYEVVKIAAKSHYAGETAITQLSERCANISNDYSYACDIAKALAANPNATATSLQPLANARYGDVSKIGHDAIDALTP